MADLKKKEMEGGGEEEKKLLDTVLDFETLCSTVALQSQGKWRLVENEGEDDEGFNGGGVLRLWEGGILDFFDDRRIAIQTLCCPCYRFGKNMKRAGLGSSFVQGAAYLILILLAAFTYIAFIITRSHCFLYIALALSVSVGAYSGFLRTRMRKKFNINNTDSYVDDSLYHLACPCCSICQEARTLEMNNVQDGTWHGRGDTICVGNFSPFSKAFFESQPPSPMSIKSSEIFTVQKSVDVTEPS